MKPTLAERFAGWDAATRVTRLSQSEQSRDKARFASKLFRTLTRLRCTSLFTTTPLRTRKRSTPMKCPLIGELKIRTQNTSGLITLLRNGLLETFTLTASKAFGAS